VRYITLYTILLAIALCYCLSLTMLLKYLLIAFLLLHLAFGGGFIASCKGIGLVSQTILGASCLTADRKIMSTSLDLSN